jgi:hypothetical protein
MMSENRYKPSREMTRKAKLMAVINCTRLIEPVWAENHEDGDIHHLLRLFMAAGDSFYPILS